MVKIILINKTQQSVNALQCCLNAGIQVENCYSLNGVFGID
jgi:hypothetical protein